MKAESILFDRLNTRNTIFISDMAYNLRQGKKKNYKELSDTKLPRARPVKPEVDDRLYQIEEREEQVKIHYKGYSSKYDEWRVKEDVVLPKEPEKYRPYDHHHGWCMQLSRYCIQDETVVRPFPTMKISSHF